MIERLEDLGELFGQFRKGLGLTQDELAAKVGVPVHRNDITRLETGQRVPSIDRLRMIATTLGIPDSVWSAFAREDTHQRQQFETALSMMVGRPVALRAMPVESVYAAENCIGELFSGRLTAMQARDALNSVLVFYAVAAVSGGFFQRYLGTQSFGSLEAFERGVYRFQIEAIRLFSTFAEAYRRLNGADDIEAALAPLKPRSLEEFGERSVWDHSDDSAPDRIVTLPEDKLEYLGYISAARYGELRRKREALAGYLCELADDLRRKDKLALDELGEKRKRRISSLLGELKSTLAHTPISALFAPNPAELEQEALLLRRDEKDQEEMQKAQSTALSNLSHYVSSDYMDVYVATSMRTKSDYISVNRFVQSLFAHEHITDLRLRYFNPTQSWIEDRIAKGLVEALMLKRCRVALYMAQKSDSFGKDSEASVALGQGKPVIVYVPKLRAGGATGLDSEALYKEDDSVLLRQLRDAGTATEDLDDLDHNGLFGKVLTVLVGELGNGDLLALVDEHWADFALLDEADRIRGDGEIARRDAYSKFLVAIARQGTGVALAEQVRNDLVAILVALTVNFEKRAKLFREIHPLALQVVLSTGVLNGILVTRSVDSCAALLRQTMENCLELALESDTFNYRLVEKTTGSTVRVISRNNLLSSAFDSQYERLP